MLYVGILVLILFFLWFSGDAATRELWHMLNQKKKLRPLAWLVLAPGVITHETAHALMALITGAGIHKFVPFWPKQTEDGGWQFGYVQPERGGVFVTGLIAMAPLWLGPLLAYFVAVLITGKSGIDIWSSWQFTVPTILWFYWLFSLSLSNMPSSTDFKLARPFLFILALILIGVVALSFTNNLSIDLEQVLLPIIFLLAPQAIITILLHGFMFMHKD